MTKNIVIKIPFNSRGANEVSFTKDWIERRLSIFMNYTLRSLEGQSSQDFLALVLYNPISEDVVKTALTNYRPLPPNVKFISSQKFHAEVMKNVQEREYLYEVHLESDDMYHRSYIELLQKHIPQRDSITLIPQYGYVYDSIQHRLGRFFFWAPSFGAVIYHTKDYLKGTRYRLELGWRGALKLPHEFICVKTPIWINHVHSKNTGISFDKIMSWKIKTFTDACEIDPWNDSEKSRAHFGPEMTDQNEITKVLGEFI